MRSTASAAVTSSVSAVPPTLVAVSASGVRCLLDVDRDHLRAVAGEHLGDRRADPAGGARDDGDLAVQRPVPVGGRRGVGSPDPEHLSVDVGGLRRQQEPQRGLEAGRGRLGVRRQVHQRRGGAVAQFLAQRAGESLERALRDALVHAAGLLRGGADDDDAARVAEVAQQRREELVQAFEALGFGDAGGVEHQSAERVGPAPAEVVGDHVVVLGQRGPQRLDHAAVAADQQRAGQRRLAGLVAAQRSRAAGRRVAWPGTNPARS